MKTDAITCMEMPWEEKQYVYATGHDEDTCSILHVYLTLLTPKPR